MASLRKWFVALSAALATGLLLPAAAWANGSPAARAVADEVAARRYGRVGGLGLLGALCCLVVLAVVVFAVLLVARGRGSRRGH